MRLRSALGSEHPVPAPDLHSRLVRNELEGHAFWESRAGLLECNSARRCFLGGRSRNPEAGRSVVCVDRPPRYYIEVARGGVGGVARRDKISNVSSIKMLQGRQNAAARLAA